MKIICEYVQVYPTSSQCKDLLNSLQEGKRYTVRSALSDLGIYALSQRVGELKRLGWPVKSVTVLTRGGARVKEYWI